jgi:pre-rRNA-processing protein TSR2
MLDEFEVNVDDESAFEVAEGILKVRRDCARGDFKGVEALNEKWNAKGGEKMRDMFVKKERDEKEDETSGSEDEDKEGGADVKMEEAPQLVRVKEPVVSEVDEDGFTKVTKKKR